MNDIIQNVKVKCITPVHVGSGLILKQNIDFFQSRENNILGIVDDNKILEVLGGENATEEAINSWVNAIDNNKSILSLPGFVTSLEDVSKRIRKIISFSNNRDLREQLHTPQSYPLLPGSSIKGAIRTAIWDVLIQDDTLTNSDIWNGREYSDKNLNIQAFAPKSNGYHLDATKDIMRFLQITDSIFENNDANIEVAKVLTEQRNGWQLKRFDENVECISKGANSNCRIKISKRNLKNNIEKNLINELPELTSIQTVFKACNNYTLKMLQTEKNFFQNDLNLRNDKIFDHFMNQINSLINYVREANNSCVIRLGHGTGYRFMTGNKVISNKIGDRELNNIFRTIRHDRRGRYDDFLYIKSRKMTSEGVPLGFVELSY